MELLLFSLALFLGGGCAALASGCGLNASRIGGFSAAAASLVGLIPVARLLVQSLPPFRSEALSLVLAKLPMGEFALRLDLLGAVFLVPVLVLSAVAAVYGMGRGDGSHDGGQPGAHWFFYNLLAGGMVLTIIADNAFLFLLAWEIMSVAPFFLITLHDDAQTTRSASWTYLVAAHLGALFLLAFFALLAAASGDSLSFASFARAAEKLPAGLNGGTGLLFLLAFIGFGAKSGIMPLHVWLPKAYAAAPAHVAAVMSGGMTNLGLYGLLRCLPFLGTGETWWAYTLITAGAFSGLLGILQAMAQTDIKRSLAFSSVENMGIILMAMGLALFSSQNGQTEAAALALTGGLVHMVNHALVKGLLFLGAGCVQNGAGSVTLHLLGGLQKRMPFVGWCFILGSAAIAALPPLNGFAGEFFIYCAMVFGGAAFVHGPNPEYSLVFWLCLFTLAGIGGFTLLCFTRLCGMVFLGEPRSAQATHAQGPARNEIAALAFMACLCLMSAIAAPALASICHTAAAPAVFAPPLESEILASAPPASESRSLAPVPAGLAAPRFAPGAGSAIGLLHTVNAVFTLFILAAAGAFIVRRRLLRGRIIRSSPTWDCGYIAPTARMQYSAGSFSRPAAWFMRTILRQKSGRPEFAEYFPGSAKACLTTPDWIETRGFVPLFSFIERVADRCKPLQHGYVNGYILYILITLVALLAWKLR